MLKKLCLLALILVVLLAAVTACSSENKLNVSEVTQQGILLRLSTDKEIYNIGENVLVTVYVKNLSSNAFKYEFSGLPGDDVPILVQVDTGPEAKPSARYLILHEGGGYGWALPANLIIDTLEIRESISQEFAWDQQMYVEANEYVQVPSGEYPISARFNYAAEDRSLHITTSVSIQIKG